MAKHPHGSRWPEQHDGRSKSPERAGEYAEQGKKLDEEALIAEMERRLGALTAGELDRLKGLVSSAKSLDELRTTVEATSEIPEMTHEQRAEIIALVEQIRTLSEHERRQLLAEVVTLNESREHEVNNAVFASHRFDFVRRLEESPLGENILRDIAGVSVGVVDTGIVILQLMLDFVVDFVRLPRDLYALASKKEER